MTKKKMSKEVQIIVEGDNKLILLFPERVDAQIRRTVELDGLMKILAVDEGGDVIGQCGYGTDRVGCSSW
jgi:hypothetical protein